jgi:hypothetical protein
VKETESLSVSRREAPPVLSSGLEELKSTDHVGLDEWCRLIDSPVDVGFGGQMHYGGRPVIPKNPADFIEVADVDPLESIARMG